jgi:hypothetical protein
MLHIVRLHTSAKLPHIRLALPVNRDLEIAVNGLFSRYLTYELSIVSLPYLLLLEFVKTELKSTLKRRQIHRTFRRTISLHSINYFKFRIFMSFRKNISMAMTWRHCNPGGPARRLHYFDPYSMFCGGAYKIQGNNLQKYNI